MRTYRQIQASRRNGRLSKGPITAAGKARAALNATTLGFTAQSVVLANESTERFQQLADHFVARYQPANEDELDLVVEMTKARWRMYRMQSYEVAMLDYQREADAPVVAKMHVQIDKTTVNMLAFRAIHDADRALAYVHRYENSYRRTYDRALEALRRLQAERQNQKYEIEPSAPQTEEGPQQQESDAGVSHRPAA